MRGIYIFVSILYKCVFTDILHIYICMFVYLPIRICIYAYVFERKRHGSVNSDLVERHTGWVVRRIGRRASTAVKLHNEGCCAFVRHSRAASRRVYNDRRLLWPLKAQVSYSYDRNGGPPGAYKKIL